MKKEKKLAEGAPSTVYYLKKNNEPSTWCQLGTHRLRLWCDIKTRRASARSGGRHSHKEEKNENVSTSQERTALLFSPLRLLAHLDFLNTTKRNHISISKTTKWPEKESCGLVSEPNSERYMSEVSKDVFEGMNSEKACTTKAADAESHDGIQKGRWQANHLGDISRHWSKGTDVLQDLPFIMCVQRAHTEVWSG